MILVNGKKKTRRPQEIAARHLNVRERSAEFFRRFRAESPYSVAELERMAGLIEGEYRSWEHGFQIPEIERILKLEPVLGSRFVMEFHLLCCRFGAEIATFIEEMKTPTSS